jgi:hypothetical protein
LVLSLLQMDAEQLRWGADGDRHPLGVIAYASNPGRR